MHLQYDFSVAVLGNRDTSDSDDTIPKVSRFGYHAESSRPESWVIELGSGGEVEGKWAGDLKDHDDTSVGPMGNGFPGQEISIERDFMRLEYTNVIGEGSRDVLI